MVIQSLNGSEFYFSFSLHCFESGHTDGIRPKEAELVRSKQMLNPPPCRGQTSSTSRGSQLRTCRCWPSFWPHHTQLGPTPAHRSQSSEAGGMLHPSTNNKALAWSFISCSGVCVFTLPLNAASCFCADSQESLSYFDSEGSLICLPELSHGQRGSIGIWTLLEKGKVKRGNEYLIISARERSPVTQQHSFIYQHQDEGHWYTTVGQTGEE